MFREPCKTLGLEMVDLLNVAYFKSFMDLMLFNLVLLLVLNLLKYIVLCRNVVSFSDGLPDKGRGIPYFYLTTLDPTARNALKDQRSSLTISEYAIGTCGKTDPENPSCAKITLIGKVVALTIPLF